MSILDAFYSLGRNINKARGQQSSTETEEGVISEKLPELKLDMDNEELAKLTAKWKMSWDDSDTKREWISKAEDNENYWKGKHFTRPDADKSRAVVDNVIFEALESYLPRITRRNPEPMITLAEKEQQTPESLQYASELQKDLGIIADKVSLRLKLKKAGRHWAIFLLGVVKMGWDMDRDIPIPKIIRPQKLILDPDSTIDEDGYTGKFIGEHRSMVASTLISVLDGIDAEQGATDEIKKQVKENLGTNVGFIEWWTDEYMCWTMGPVVLLKKKNPHWNYDQTQQDTTVDDLGNETPVENKVPGFNHLPVPEKPYIFLSVFNLGTQPVDDTSLIGQNLANQDMVNKRLKQIDRNADSMNNGMVVSLERTGLTKDQAKGVTEAIRKGGTVVIPAGSPQEAVFKPQTPSLPADVFNNLVDMRTRTRDIFGTSGSTPSGVSGEKTVRGKLITTSLDTDRIGGGISEYLEQMADKIYNWCIQLLYVYDDVYAAKQGKPRVDASVKEGSLLPKDSTTIANQAVDLSTAGKMSTIDLYKRLDYPNPEEMAANVWLEANAPEILFANDPRVQQAIQARQAATNPAKPPSESINFKDLPPDGQAQLAAKAGIQLHPEAIAAHNDFKKAQDAATAPPAPIIQ